MANKLPQTPAKGKDSFLKSMDSIIFAVKSGKTPCRTATPNVRDSQSAGKQRLSHTPPTQKPVSSSSTAESVTQSAVVKPDKHMSVSMPAKRHSDKESLSTRVPDASSHQISNAVRSRPEDSQSSYTGAKQASDTAETWRKAPSGVTLIKQSNVSSTISSNIKSKDALPKRETTNPLSCESDVQRSSTDQIISKVNTPVKVDIKLSEVSSEEKMGSKSSDKPVSQRKSPNPVVYKLVTSPQKGDGKGGSESDIQKRDSTKNSTDQIISSVITQQKMVIKSSDKPDSQKKTSTKYLDTVVCKLETNPQKVVGKGSSESDVKTRDPTKGSIISSNIEPAVTLPKGETTNPLSSDCDIQRSSTDQIISKVTTPPKMDVKSSDKLNSQRKTSTKSTEPVVRKLVTAQQKVAGKGGSESDVQTRDPTKGSMDQIISKVTLVQKMGNTNSDKPDSQQKSSTTKSSKPIVRKLVTTPQKVVVKGSSESDVQMSSTAQLMSKVTTPQNIDVKSSDKPDSKRKSPTKSTDPVVHKLVTTPPKVVEKGGSESDVQTRDPTKGSTISSNIKPAVDLPKGETTNPLSSDCDVQKRSTDQIISKVTTPEKMDIKSIDKPDTQRMASRKSDFKKRDSGKGSMDQIISKVTSVQKMGNMDSGKPDSQKKISTNSSDPVVGAQLTCPQKKGSKASDKSDIQRKTETQTKSSNPVSSKLVTTPQKAIRNVSSESDIQKSSSNSEHDVSTNDSVRDVGHKGNIGPAKKKVTQTKSPKKSEMNTQKKMTGDKKQTLHVSLEMSGVKGQEVSSDQPKGQEVSSDQTKGQPVRSDQTKSVSHKKTELKAQEEARVQTNTVVSPEKSILEATVDVEASTGPINCSRNESIQSKEADIEIVSVSMTEAANDSNDAKTKKNTSSKGKGISQKKSSPFNRKSKSTTASKGVATVKSDSSKTKALDKYDSLVGDNKDPSVLKKSKKAVKSPAEKSTLTKILSVAASDSSSIVTSEGKIKATADVHHERIGLLSSASTNDDTNTGVASAMPTSSKTKTTTDEQTGLMTSVSPNDDSNTALASVVPTISNTKATADERISLMTLASPDGNTNTALGFAVPTSSATTSKTKSTAAEHIGLMTLESPNRDSNTAVASPVPTTSKDTGNSGKSVDGKCAEIPKSLDKVHSVIPSDTLGFVPAASSTPRTTGKRTKRKPKKLMDDEENSICKVPEVGLQDVSEIEGTCKSTTKPKKERKRKVDKGIDVMKIKQEQKSVVETDEDDMLQDASRFDANATENENKMQVSGQLFKPAKGRKKKQTEDGNPEKKKRKVDKLVKESKSKKKQPLKVIDSVEIDNENAVMAENEVIVPDTNRVVKKNTNRVVKKKRRRPPKDIKLSQTVEVVVTKIEEQDKSEKELAGTSQGDLALQGISLVSQDSDHSLLKDVSSTSTPKKVYTGKKRGRKKKEVPKPVEADFDADINDKDMTEAGETSQALKKNVAKGRKTKPACLGKRKLSQGTGADNEDLQKKDKDTTTEDGGVEILGYKPPVKKRKKKQDDTANEKSTLVEHEEEDVMEVTDEVNEEVTEVKDIETPGTSGRRRRAAALKAKNAWCGESIISDSEQKEVVYYGPKDPLPVSEEFMKHLKVELTKNQDRGKVVCCPFKNCGKPYWNLCSMKFHLGHCNKGMRGLEYSGYECSECGHRTKSEKAIKAHVHQHMMNTTKNPKRQLAVETEDGGVFSSEDDLDLDWKGEGSGSEEVEESGSQAENELCEPVEEEPVEKFRTDRRSAGFGKVIHKTVGKFGPDVKNPESKSKYVDGQSFLGNFNSDLVQVSMGRMPPILESSFPWTLDFFKKHERENLYPDLVYKPGDLKLLTDSERKRRLVQSNPMSLEFSAHGSKLKVTSPITLNVFESHTSSISCSTTVNVGGPVWALAWCPTPLSQTGAQFLALYCHTGTSRRDHNIHSPHHGPTLIQIWDCGKLSSKSQASPSLAYCISLDVGAVWEMCWCPTGCYDNPDTTGSQEHLGRLGLLAMACSAGHVEILSVPTPASVKALSQSSSTQPLVIKPQARWRLRPQFRGAAKANCLCVDWQWTDGCPRLVAGFSDGSVSLWNLSKSPTLLNRRCTDGATEWLAYRTFVPHRDAVTGVSFLPRVPQYLVTISLDKDLKVIDERCPGEVVDVYNRVRGTNIIAPINWLLWIASYDDSLIFARNGSYAAECGYIERGGMSLITVKSTVRNQSFNHWLNTLAMATTGGEVFLNYLHFGIYVNRIKKSLNQRRLVLYSSSVVEHPVSGDRGEEGKEGGQQGGQHTSSHSTGNTAVGHTPEKPTETGASADNTVQGILFKDSRLLENKDICKTCGEGAVDAFLTHKTKRTFVNRVAWNPNLGAHTWLASATDGGLLRLHRVSALETSNMATIQKDYLKQTKTSNN